MLHASHCYGIRGEAADTGGKWWNTCALSVAHFVAFGHIVWIVAALIARAVSCSDFRIRVPVRSQPHRTSSSTKCSSRARRSGACSGWMASVAQGARGCGWSKHESGPALHALQLCSIEYVPPNPACRERVATAVHADSQRDVRQTAAVSRCVSELHGKKYRILEIYVFAAWKPVLTCRGGLQGQRWRAMSKPPEHPARTL